MQTKKLKTNTINDNSVIAFYMTACRRIFANVFNLLQMRSKNKSDPDIKNTKDGQLLAAQNIHKD